MIVNPRMSNTFLSRFILFFWVFKSYIQHKETSTIWYGSLSNMSAMYTKNASYTFFVVFFFFYVCVYSNVIYSLQTH